MHKYRRIHAHFSKDTLFFALALPNVSAFIVQRMQRFTD